MRIVLYQPETGDFIAVRKLARNFRAELVVVVAGGPYDVATNGAPLVALEHHRGSVPLGKWRVPQGVNFTVVTGSMNHGLPQEVLDLCDEIVQVEQFDDTGFLSPATALSILTYKVFMETANRSGVWG